MSQSGFVKLPVVLAAVFGLGLGASAYLNYYQHQRAAQDEKLMQGTITDLRYQVAQDKLAASPSPSPSDSPSPSPDATPAPSPSPSPSPGGQVAGASTQTATLKQNARFHVAADIKSASTWLTAGTTVTVVGDAPNGYKQVTVNGKTGYVLASFLQ